MTTMRFPAGRFYVLPSASLRQLVERHAQRLLPGCNYLLTWKDAKGYGIELARADWVPPGHVYRA